MEREMVLIQDGSIMTNKKKIASGLSRMYFKKQ